VVVHSHSGPAKQLALDNLACWFHADISCLPYLRMVVISDLVGCFWLT
jgi:hypothetical protein